MEKRLLFAALLLSAIWAGSCRHKEVEVKEEDKLTKPHFDSLTFLRAFYIAKAGKVVGKDTLSVFDNELYRRYHEIAFLHFLDGGYVYFYSGTSIPNTQFVPTAKTFYSTMRFSLPTNMKYYWDEAKNTVAVESVGTSNDLNIIPPGKKGYLVKSLFNLTNSFEEAKNAKVPKSMTFIFEDYVIELKPMWRYAHLEFDYQADLVVF